MKQVFFSFFFCWVANLVFAQQHESDIHQAFVRFEQSLKSHEKGLPHIYPKVLTAFSKEKVLQFSDNKPLPAQVDLMFVQLTLNGISKLIDYQGIKYALVKYTDKHVMDINGRHGPANISRVAALLIASHKFTRASKKVNFYSKRLMIAIKDPQFGNEWKFISKDKNAQPIWEKVIPKAVLREYTKNKLPNFGRFFCLYIYLFLLPVALLRAQKACPVRITSSTNRIIHLNTETICCILPRTTLIICYTIIYRRL